LFSSIHFLYYYDKVNIVVLSLLLDVCSLNLFLVGNLVTFFIASVMVKNVRQENKYRTNAFEKFEKKINHGTEV